MFEKFDLEKAKAGQPIEFAYDSNVANKWKWTDAIFVGQTKYGIEVRYFTNCVTCTSEYQLRMKCYAKQK